jgi:hypothetical protein
MICLAKKGNRLMGKGGGGGMKREGPGRRLCPRLCQLGAASTVSTTVQSGGRRVMLVPLCHLGSTSGRAGTSVFQTLGSARKRDRALIVCPGATVGRLGESRSHSSEI